MGEERPDIPINSVTVLQRSDTGTVGAEMRTESFLCPLPGRRGLRPEPSAPGTGGQLKSAYRPAP